MSGVGAEGKRGLEEPLLPSAERAKGGSDFARKGRDLVPLSMSEPDFRAYNTDKLEYPDIGFASAINEENQEEGQGGMKRSNTMQTLNTVMDTVFDVIGPGYTYSFYGVDEDEYDKSHSFSRRSLRHRKVKKPLELEDGVNRESDEGSSAVELQQKPSGAGIITTSLVLWKGFVGPATLYLPAAFKQGGLIFSIVAMIFLGGFNLFTMLRLVQCRKAIVGSYGDMGQASMGKLGRVLVDVSVILSQLGFCCSYFIFLAKNAETISHQFNFFGLEKWMTILGSAVLLSPFTWVRKLKFFALSNMLADLLITGGIIYIVYIFGQDIHHDGAQGKDMINLMGTPLFVGASMVAFEGIGLVIPIHESMGDNAHRFPMLVTVLFTIITFVFVAFGSLGYVAYGPAVESPVTVNIMATAPKIPGVICLGAFCAAVFLTFPVQLFPAVCIMELRIFGPSKVPSLGRKWAKNFFRVACVFFSAAVAYLGSKHLEYFISLVGSFCCIPLSFIYPPLFHFILVKDAGICDKVINVASISLGVVLAVVSTAISIYEWIHAVV